MTHLLASARRRGPGVHLSRRKRGWGGVAAVLLLVTGCGSSGPPQRTVTVFAAASLTKAFQAEGKAFQDSHPDLRVTFSFAGSQSLVAQVQQGAPASVLATADLATIAAVKSRLSGPPVVFAHNQLAIATAKGDPLHLTTLASLAKPGLKVVLAGPTVPVGKAAANALKAAGITVHPVSLEDAVTGVVTKVRLGEADAGIVYATDLTGSDVGGVALSGTSTSLAIAALSGIPAPADAEAFIAFVRSDPGHTILTSYGFQ
ncbi:MAG: molybdenum transporter, periplasmic molybdate-binding protein [Frankiales bacterium]|nr:molybdenum transporter, periplasmic molybdate-binding protein [Frankiales bacterium]